MTTTGTDLRREVLDALQAGGLDPADVLAALDRTDGPLTLQGLETTALHTVATVLAAAALARTESRGCHRRSDAPETRSDWEVRLVHRLDPDGSLATRVLPLAGVHTDVVVA